MRIRAAVIVACVVAGLTGHEAAAVYINPDGEGQGLIFPYYTVQTTGSHAFNTYVSISNSLNDTKVVKVRFREGKNSRPVAEFNLYLAPNDSWAAVLVPEGDGVRMVTADTSCTNPALPAAGTVFTNSSYASGDDGAGTGLDRTREGHIDVIEMGVLTGSTAASVAHDFVTGQATNCAAVQGNAVDLGIIGNPSGGLYGSATLINVVNGMDLTYNADALANLSTASMYSAPNQAGTDFDSPQIDRVSYIVANNVSYRLNWSRGIDAVSSLFMSALSNDFILDAPTASKTDWVVTFPTRRFYVTSSGSNAPFSHSFGTSFANCEGLSYQVYDREGRLGFPPTTPPPAGASPYAACWSANAFAIWQRTTNGRTIAQSDVFGSRNTLFHQEPPAGDGGTLAVPSFFSSGRLGLTFDPIVVPSLTSLPTSIALDLASGSVTSGSVVMRGLPWTGFMARTFENGTLTCGSINCQGNYSGIFPHRRERLAGRN